MHHKLNRLVSVQIACFALFVAAVVMFAGQPVLAIQHDHPDQRLDQNELRDGIKPLIPKLDGPPLQQEPPPARPDSSAAVRATPIPVRPAQPSTLIPKTTTRTMTIPATPAPKTMVDPNLQPTNYTAPQRRAPTNTELATEILTELSIDGTETTANGRPTSLREMLAQSNGRSQKPLIHQYWNTWRAWAELRFAIDELRWIQQIGHVHSEAERLTLEAALSAANDSISDRALKLSQQQHLLGRYIARAGSMPIPSDKPLVTRYRTNFDQYAAKQAMPNDLRMINSWLPKQQQLIGDRAATVQRCRNAALQATQTDTGNHPVTSTLQTIGMCRECHSAFVATVVLYNQTIANYALAVQPNQYAPEKIVAMLIPVKQNPGLVPTGLPNGYPGELPNEFRQATLPRTAYDRSSQNYQNNVLPQSQPLNHPADSNAFHSGNQAFDPAANPPPAMNPNQFNSNPQFQPQPTVPAQQDGTFRR